MAQPLGLETFRAGLNLYLRNAPTRRAAIVAEVPVDSRGLSLVEPCRTRWCRVSWQGLQGWVYRRLLVPDDGLPVAGDPALRGGRFAVLRTSTLHEFPGEDMPVVATIPSGAKDVATLGRCVGVWCHVEHGGVAGWTHREALVAVEPQRTETAALAPTLGQPRQRPDSIRRVRVEGVAPGAVLEIHAEPGAATQVVTRIPAGAEIEATSRCSADWCAIRHGAVSGWAQRRYLADLAMPVRRFSATGIALWDTLPVAAYPADGAPQIGAIPSYGSGIVAIGECAERWCHIRYNDVVGFVPTANLAETEGAR